MQYSSSLAAATRKGRAFLPALTLSVMLTATTPGLGSGETAIDLRDLIREFNSICADLQTARCDLQKRVLDETAFGDRILELFIRADSITTLLEARLPGPRHPGPTYPLQWALMHLRQSLRENFEGIVEGNGYRFVSADLALKAAEAWQGKLTSPEASPRQ